MQEHLYRVPLEPGWNLISFPGQPTGPSLLSIFNEHPYVVIVLGYDGEEDEWQTAIREDDAQWVGSLTKVEAEKAYFVHSRTFDMLEVPLMPVPNHGPLLALGWNLIGCIDIKMATAGEPAGEVSSLDDYLDGTDWRIAYTLPLPSLRGDNEEFAALPPNAGHLICAGRGYWVWCGPDYDDSAPPNPPELYLQGDVESRMGYSP